MKSTTLIIAIFKFKSTIMKKRLTIFLMAFLILDASFLRAQSKISQEDLKPLIGNWHGSLTYLDYSSGKPYTMPANIQIKLSNDAKDLIIANIYPNEPKANSVDTLKISDNGTMINRETVVSISKLKNGSKQIVTEISGKDGNDNKAAIIRHTYAFDKNSFSNRKDVQFAGEKTWIKRHEYLYFRTK